MNNLRFADDVILIDEDPKELEKMIEELEEKSKEGGLKMNLLKTNKLVGEEER